MLRSGGGRDDVLVRGAGCSVADHVSDAVLEAVVLHPPPHFLAVQVRLGAGDGPLDGEQGLRARLVNLVDSRHHVHGIVIYPRRYPFSS